MKVVAWEPVALQEYDDALAVSRDPAEFQRAIADALGDIASGRVAHARVAGRTARRCILTTLPYSIIETDDEIRVWAFPHSSRKPGYWKNRLPKT